MLSYRLSRSMQEIEAMKTTEFMEWVAFFEIQSDLGKQNGRVR